VNGAVDAADPAVVSLLHEGATFCSGSLISPNVVLTAGHCLSIELTGIPVTEIEVFFGNEVADGGTVTSVVDGGPHPLFDPTEIPPTYELNDIGILQIETPSRVEPFTLSSEPVDNSFIGRSLRLVGFGYTGPDGDNAGIKRSGTSVIEDLPGTIFYMGLTPAGTCNGDSGGAALLTTDGGDEVLAAIHSLSDCETEMAEERVDLHVSDFIQPFVDAAAAPACDRDGRCAPGCTAPDPDCPCADDGFCTSACSEPASDPDCAASCGADGACDEDCGGQDPDCEPARIADDVCDEDCGDRDPDCDAEPQSGGAGGGRNEDEGGCAMAARGAPSPAFVLLLLGGLAVRRRAPRRPHPRT
jgi:hypothetical protein